jgi:hypothetical protein
MNPWMILGVALAVATAGGAGLYQGRELGMASVQQQWDKERAAQEAAYAQAQEEARAKEQALQANADVIRQEKDREIRNLNARTVALTNSLRDRSERPSTEASTVSIPTENGSIATGCTGEKLYRPDGEFLAREAARGDELRILLKQCRDQYEAISK